MDCFILFRGMACIHFTRTGKFRKAILPDCIRKFNALLLVTRNSFNVTEFVRQAILIYCIMALTGNLALSMLNFA